MSTQTEPFPESATATQPSRANDEYTFSYDSVPLLSASTHMRLLDIFPLGWESDSNLQPADPEAQIHARIYVVPIERLPEYKALSYVWGSSHRTHSVILSGKTLGITTSLNEALCHLRHANEVVTIWIDQICINQHSTQEKAKQVKLMGEFYSCCNQVLIWLGPSEEGSDRLMEAWAAVGQQARDWGLESYLNKEHASHFLNNIVTNADPSDPVTRGFQDLVQRVRDRFLPQLAAIVRWYQRPWFTRLWVVQEFCLGTDAVFVCGSAAVDVELVKLANFVFNAIPSRALRDDQSAEWRSDLLLARSKDPLSALFGARRKRRAGPGHNLLQLLEFLIVDSGLACSVYRDRIFGLLGLAADAVSLGICVNYDATDVEVLCHVARAIVDGSQTLDLLTYAQHPKAVEGLPSWVPDWRSNLRPSFYTISEIAGEVHLYAASGETQPLFFLGESERELGLGGIVVDTIDQVGDYWVEQFEQSARADFPFLSQIRNLCHMSAQRPDNVYGSEEAYDQAAWRVPIGNIFDSERGQVRASSTAAASYRDNIVIAEFLSTGKTSLATEELTTGLKRLASSTDLFSADNRQHIPGPGHGEPRLGAQLFHNKGNMARYHGSMSKMSGMRPFITKKGYVGIGPPDSTTGDVVVVLFGSRVPYVLRQSDIEKHFLIGEAYCHGVMDGEIMAAGSTEKFFLV